VVEIEVEDRGHYDRIEKILRTSAIAMGVFGLRDVPKQIELIASKLAYNADTGKPHVSEKECEVLCAEVESKWTGFGFPRPALFFNTLQSKHIRTDDLVELSGCDWCEGTGLVYVRPVNSDGTRPIRGPQAACECPKGNSLTRRGEASMVSVWSLLGTYTYDEGKGVLTKKGGGRKMLRADVTGQRGSDNEKAAVMAWWEEIEAIVDKTGRDVSNAVDNHPGPAFTVMAVDSIDGGVDPW